MTNLKIAWVAIVCVAVSCSEGSGAQTNPLVPAKPANGLDRDVEELLSRIRMSPQKENEGYFQMLVEMSQARDLVPVVMKLHSALPAEDFASRLFHLSILGEFQDPRTFDLLESIVWQQTKPHKLSSHLDSPLSKQEMLQGKALHGIGYLRSTRAQQCLLDVVSKHPSVVVRVEAMAAFQWNSKDPRKARKILREHAPISLHSYIDMPRFYPGRTRDAFNDELAEWRAKWRSSAL